MYWYKIRFINVNKSYLINNRAQSNLINPTIYRNYNKTAIIMTYNPMNQNNFGHKKAKMTIDFDCINMIKLPLI